MKEKTKGVLIDAVVYLVAFGVAAVPFIFIENIFGATAAFTATATLVVFIASCIFSDVSVYDPYRSVAPPVMMIADMIKYRVFTVNAFFLLAVVLVWAVRLTANWYGTYRGIGHEDWRYAQYRERYSPLPFQVVSFFGFHLVPTLVVFGGVVYKIGQKVRLSFSGDSIMLFSRENGRMIANGTIRL